MSATPPRRSRPPGSPPPSSSLPLVPILIAVIVLGFVIGAGLSLVGKHGDRTVVASAPTDAPGTAMPTDAPAASTPASAPAPTAVPTLAPTETPSAAASVRPAPASPAPRPSRVPVAAVTLAPVRTPKPATPEPAPPPTPTDEPTRAVVAPRRTPPRPSPALRPSAIPVAAATGAPTPAPTDETDGDFAKLASSVVRQYLGAVERGDTASARAAFGDAPPADALDGTGIVDASTRIEHLEAHSAGDNVTVDVDMRSSAGLLFGQFTVHRTPSGAALITTHAINKL